MVNMKSNNKSPIDRKQKRHDHGARTLFFFFTVIKTHNTFYLQTLCIYY